MLAFGAHDACVVRGQTDAVRPDVLGACLNWGASRALAVLKLCRSHAEVITAACLQPDRVASTGVVPVSLPEVWIVRRAPPSALGVIAACAPTALLAIDCPLAATALAASAVPACHSIEDRSGEALALLSLAGTRMAAARYTGGADSAALAHAAAAEAQDLTTAVALLDAMGEPQAQAHARIALAAAVARAAPDAVAQAASAEHHLRAASDFARAGYDTHAEAIARQAIGGDALAPRLSLYLCPELRDKSVILG
jgi:hypothetical protein